VDQFVRVARDSLRPPTAHPTHTLGTRVLPPVRRLSLGCLIDLVAPVPAMAVQAHYHHHYHRESPFLVRYLPWPLCIF
jgi:hypothetical protein